MPDSESRHVLVCCLFHARLGESGYVLVVVSSLHARLESQANVLVVVAFHARSSRVRLRIGVCFLSMPTESQA